MGLKSYTKMAICKQMAKEAALSTSLAAKASNFIGGGIKALTKKTAKGPGSLLRKINPTTPYGMV